MFFKKKKRKNVISDKIIDCHKRGAKNLHMMIYHGKGLLFQVLPAKHFQFFGLEANDNHTYTGLHSFHKTQQTTISELEGFKSSDLNKEHQYLEAEKNVYQFVKKLGSNPIEIQKYIVDCIINIYKVDNPETTWIDYSEY